MTERERRADYSLKSSKRRKHADNIILIVFLHRIATSSFSNGLVWNEFVEHLLTQEKTSPLVFSNQTLSCEITSSLASRLKRILTAFLFIDHKPELDTSTRTTKTSEVK